jgi:hypothetical protein
MRRTGCLVLASAFALAAAPLLLRRPVAEAGSAAPRRVGPTPVAEAPRPAEARLPLGQPGAPNSGLDLGLLERVHEREGRGPAIEAALRRPELPAWVLERLERADFPPERRRSLAWLLRAVLTVWEELPDPEPTPRDRYLARVVAAGAGSDRSAAVVRLCWSRQRLLSADHLGLVQTARPTDLDLPAGAAGAERAAMHLALLEDAWRGCLERGLDAAVIEGLEDPSRAVRQLARRLWFATERSGGWKEALLLLAGWPHAEQADLLTAMAAAAPPEEALATLTAAEFAPQERAGFLGAWIELARRAPDLVGDRYAELLASGQRAVLPQPRGWGDTGPDADPSLALEDVLREGRGRNHLLTAGLLAGGASGRTDWSRVEDAAWMEWNPVVRSTAWRALTAGGPQPSATALQQLMDPSWVRGARLPGVEDDGHLMPGLAALAGALPLGRLGDLERGAAGLRLAEEQAAEFRRLLEERRRAASDM